MEILFRSLHGTHVDRIDTKSQSYYGVSITRETKHYITINATVVEGDGGEYVEDRRIPKTSIVEVFE